MLKKICAAALASSFAMQAQATDTNEALDNFLHANVLGIFYHELGHAVIDAMQVPIFGQEEDAADVMAVMLMNWMFEEESAQAIAYDSAFGYINDPEMTQEVAYWDLHGPDEQRYYNHVCLFYGANPDERDDLAEDLGLPEERAASCPEEYDMAASSWGGIFEEMEQQLDSDPALVFEAGSGSDADFVNQILADEVSNMNSNFRLPHEVEVKVDACGEANAYYDPQEREIVFCSEFVDHLRGIYEQVSAD